MVIRTERLYMWQAYEVKVTRLTLGELLAGHLAGSAEKRSDGGQQSAEVIVVAAQR